MNESLQLWMDGKRIYKDVPFSFKTLMDIFTILGFLRDKTTQIISRVIADENGCCCPKEARNTDIKAVSVWTNQLFGGSVFPQDPKIFRLLS